MSRNHQIIVYGSYGYTGTLILDECRKLNLDVLLSGRDPLKLKKQSEQYGYPYETVSIDNHLALVKLLSKGTLVIHCGGPFQFSSRQMIDACLEAETHYTDITGEYQVFELLASYDQKAKSRKILVMPGVGFDVVPSDCLALHLKNVLPTATNLQLAFKMSKGGLSRGTAKTMVEGMGEGSVVRKNGELVGIPLGEKVIHIDFGNGPSPALCIPWGDVSTAWRSTAIPNIEVYTGVSEKAIRGIRIGQWFNWLMRNRTVKNFLLNKINKRPSGPDEQRRVNGKSFLYGKVWDSEGRIAAARLETISGYLLTAKTAVLIAQKILHQEARYGYFTPAQYFGADLILEVPGSKRFDI